jgi:ABC-type Fe3+/spermidine/putrescine transport system ATPase subunit
VGSDVLLFVRPERVSLRPPAEDSHGLRARVTDIEYLGSLVRYTVTAQAGWTMLVDAPPLDGVRQMGEEVTLSFSVEHAQVFPRATAGEVTGSRL